MQGMSLHFRTIFVESFTTSRNKTTSKQVYTLSADIFGILELLDNTRLFLGGFLPCSQNRF